MPVLKKETATGARLIVGYLGIFTVMIGVILLLPLLLLVFYPGEMQYAKCFIVPGVAAILIGYLLMFLIKGKKEGTLSGHWDAVLLLLVWIITIVFSAIPFALFGNLTFTQAIFEMTSGYTTSGYTVCDVETLPKLFLFFRSLTHLFGGVGLILIMTSALSDRYGVNLYNAEGHPDKLVPNLVNSARIIFSIYALFIALGTVAYTLFGMTVFDAFNHSVAAVATGGFSTRNESMGFYINDTTGAYNATGIEITTIVLMLLGMTNFFVNLFFVTGKWKKGLRHAELWFNGLFLLVTVPLCALFLANAGISSSYGKGVEHSIFHLVSAASSTGYTTLSGFQNFPSAVLLIFFFAMLVGGGQGSTAGGIKQNRIVLMLKSIYWNLRDRFSKTRTVRTNKMWRCGEYITITDKAAADNNVFIQLYLAVVLVGTLLLAACGFPFKESLLEFTSLIGNTGISYGVISSASSPLVLWIGTVGMFIGRLEVYIVAVALVQCGLGVARKEVM
jgi:trk system potassium uptake protein TrkH